MGTKERRIREKQRRAEQIQTAAGKVFVEKGYQAATIQTIAREAELSVGAIYFYFKTKEEIFGTINLRFIERLDREMDRFLADESLSPEDKVRRLWGLMVEVYCQSPLSRLALAHGVLQGSLQNISENLLQQINDTGRSIIKKVGSVFREGMDQGLFRPANETALADLFWATFTGVTAWEEAKSTTDPQKRHLRTTLDLALDTFIKGRKVHHRGDGS